MINRNIYTTIFLILPVFFSLFAAAQGKTTIRATADKVTILIGEPIKLTLEADIPDNQPIRFFQLDSIAHFEYISVDKIDTSNTSDGTILSQVIQLTSFDSGHWVIPPFVLSDKIATDTIPVDVGYTPFDRNQPYHDIKDIIEVTAEEEKKKIPWWWPAIAAAVLLLLILFFALRKKKKPKPVVIEQPVDHYKVAMNSLEKLQKEKNDSKQYYSKLVDIFRVYVLARKGIHSLQQTTDDLVIQLRNLEMPKEQFEHLSQSLRISDFVKFAKYVPQAEDDRNSFETIKKSIDYIEQMK